jgi:hypothetical protein
MDPIPPHANKTDRTSVDERATAPPFIFAYPPRLRIDAYRELVRIDLGGVVTCGGGCGDLPLGRCEHHEVEYRLRRPVDPRRPDDLAIACALRLEAEYRDDDGIDYEKQIREHAAAGRITADRKRRLITLENANRDREIESAAFELTTARDGRSPIGSAPPRRWRDDLDSDETKDRGRLEQARFNGGLSSEDRKRYEQLTVPQPVEPIDWGVLPRGLYDEAEGVVNRRRDLARGYGRDRRVPGTRHRYPAYLTPLPFSHQIGVIMTSDDPYVLEGAVRDLRRNAKRHGFLPADHDRRRKQAGS